VCILTRSAGEAGRDLQEEAPGGTRSRDRGARHLRAFAAVVAAIGLFLSAAPALAAPPSGTLDSVSAVSYASAHLVGTVHPVPGGETYWRFDYSTDGTNWVEGPGEAHGGPVADDPTTVEADLTGLKGGTNYRVRLAMNNVAAGEPDAFSPQPDAEFETLAVDPPAVVSIDDAAAVSYTSATVAGRIERPANPDPAFDAHCRFEYVGDQQFTQNQGNGAPLFEGGGTVPCEPPAAESTPGQSDVTASLTGLAVGTTYHLRLAVSDAGGADSEEAADTFTTLDPGAPTVSIDPVTAVTAAGAHFSGQITPGGTDPAFGVDWEFLCHPACPGLGGHIAPDNSSHQVEADATGLEPHRGYTVELVATNAAGPASAGPQGFQTDPVAPGVETLPAFAIQGGTEALVGGVVDPKNSATAWWVEYGTDTNYGKSLPVSQDADAGEGNGAQVLTEKLTGLVPSTEYHLRLVAKNAAGQETQGHDVNFETAPAGPATEPCGNEALRSENGSTGLPDCRAYEQVSPVDKNGYDAGINILSAIAFDSTGAFGDALAAQTVNNYLARRGSGGWTTHGLDPVESPRPNTEWPHFVWYSPDLRYTMLINPPNASIAPGDNPTQSNLYLRDNLTDTFHTLSLESPLGVAGSDPGTPRVFFDYRSALTPGAVEGEPNVYEWDDGQVRLVSLGTDGNPIPGGATLAKAIEADGSSVVVFQVENGSGQGPLFLRKDGQTFGVSVSQRTTPDPEGPGTSHFWGASADGSKIFFTDTEALTEDAQLGGVPKLYRYDVATNTVTDLSASALGQELAESVAAVSADGSYVYFRSHSQFHAGENESGQSALYLWHDGTITFIGSDPGNALEATQRELTTYRLSPDGRHLSFATASRMTSYDSADAGTGGQDGEVYVYDAGPNRLTCVSCNPSGRPPTGTSGFPKPPPEQLQNLQSGVTNDGRIFFNSRDALVPQDINGKEDVYEWEDGRVHLISSGTDGNPSGLSSSSVSGDDVFIATRSQLVAADRDEVVDIYDARVGGGFPKPPPPGLCEGIEGCHGSAGVAPPFSDPASGTLSSPLKPPSPNARRLHKALKACKHKPKRARAKCRAAAKKRYGKASGGRAH
jgi:hypothetical protein